MRQNIEIKKLIGALKKFSAYCGLGKVSSTNIENYNIQNKLGGSLVYF